MPIFDPYRNRVVLDRDVDVKYAFEAVNDELVQAGYKPITPLELFAKVNTGNAIKISIIVFGSFRERISKFFKAIVSLYSLKGSAKRFIAFFWAVFGAIFGRIIVTVEVEKRKPCSSLCLKKAHTCLSALRDSGLDPEKITLSQAFDKLEIDNMDADCIRKVFSFALKEEALPMSQYDFDSLTESEYIQFKDDNDCGIDEQNRYIQEIIFAIVMFSGCKIKFYATTVGIRIESTNERYDPIDVFASISAVDMDGGLYVDTTGRLGKEINREKYDFLEYLRRDKFDVYECKLQVNIGWQQERTFDKFLRRNANSMTAGCYYLDKSPVPLAAETERQYIFRFSRSDFEVHY
jgi:hypothetical protein